MPVLSQAESHLSSADRTHFMRLRSVPMLNNHFAFSPSHRSARLRSGAIIATRAGSATHKLVSFGSSIRTWTDFTLGDRVRSGLPLGTLACPEAEFTGSTSAKRSANPQTTQRRRETSREAAFTPVSTTIRSTSRQSGQTAPAINCFFNIVVVSAMLGGSH